MIILEDWINIKEERYSLLFWFGLDLFALALLGHLVYDFAEHSCVD